MSKFAFHNDNHKPQHSVNDLADMNDKDLAKAMGMKPGARWGDGSYYHGPDNPRVSGIGRKDK